jgi:hydrogenase nickel incorporation protein HypA/HybF
VRAMHEMGVSEAIVEAALRRAAGRRVSSVRVRVGGGHAMDRGALTQWFQIAAAGTVAEDAAVDLVEEPVVVRCGDCGNEAVAKDAAMTVACSRCGGVDVALAGSDEIVLESIAVEAPQ